MVLEKQTVNPLFSVMRWYGKNIQHRGKWRVHSFLRNRFKLNKNKEFTVTHGGLRWQLNPSDYTQERFFWLGEMDAAEINQIASRLSPGAVIFDVGANFGYYGIALANRLARQCSVHSFEPFPDTLQRLRTNIALNQLQDVVKSVPFGLADSAGTGTMVAKEGHSGGAHFDAHPQQSTGPQVALTTLDEYCSAYDVRRIDFIKIDVEGYEGKVINGGRIALKTFKPLLMVEFNPVTMAKANARMETLRDDLIALGYKLFHIRQGILHPLARLPHGRDYINVFCLP